MPMINGEFRHVSLEEWVDGKTFDGIALDPDKVAGYRRKATRFNPSGSKPFKIDRPKQAEKTQTQLVGDELANLLKEYKLESKSSCACKSWAGKMNEWGVSGCREHRAEIIAHLNEAYHAATWWESMGAAWNAVYQSLPYSLGGMVDEAIRRTESAGAFKPVATDKPEGGRRLVITIATGHGFDELLSITSPLMRAYAARIGADFVALTNETQSWWGLEKFRVRKYAEAYDRTLFLDADVIVRPETPDMFSLVPVGSVGLHQDHPHLVQDKWLATEWASVMASQGVSRPLPESSCLNTGVVVCDRATAYIWESPPRRLPGEHCDEQVWIESTIRTFGVPVTELHSSLNCQWWFTDFAKREPMSSVVHLANAPKAERVKLARKFTQQRGTPREGSVLI